VTETSASTGRLRTRARERRADAVRGRRGHQGGATSAGRALATLVRAEVRLFLREPATAIFSLAFPLVLLVVLASVFGGTPALRFDGLRPGEFYLVSYLGVVIGALGLVSLPVQIATYRERGLLRRYRAAGVRSWIVLTAQLLTTLLVAIVAAALLVGVGALLYGTAGPAHPLSVALTFVVGACGFGGIGILLGLLLPGPRAAQAIGLVLFFPFWLLSGAGPPPQLLHGPLRHIAADLPLSYLVHALRTPWSGSGPDLVALGFLAAGGAAAIVAAHRLLRRPE